MKAKETYLRGKSIFIVSIIVILVTILIVYFSGLDDNRSITSNFYLSLSIIGFCLFSFMSFGLYRGIGLIDDFPKKKVSDSSDFFTNGAELPDLPDIGFDDGLGGIFVSLIFWVLMTIALFLSLIILDLFFVYTLFLMLTMLYWLFFRALKLVFNKSKITKGNLSKSMMYAFGYTLLYTGWLYGLVFLSEMVR